MLTIDALAKMNLTLEVLYKRSDGYHEIRSVMQTISLSDRLTFTRADEISFQCDDPVWQAQKSLAMRAAEALTRHTGVTRGALIHISKHIPLSSGLGGDSSDAAGVLQGLNQLWGLGVPEGDLVRLGANLGSDVPFFFSGGTALARGRGELISPLPEMRPAWLVLLSPQVPCPASKTATLYSLLRPEHFTPGSRSDALVLRLTRGERVSSRDLYNGFENVAFAAFNGLQKTSDEFQQIAGEAVHLAGAGPTLFALFDNEDKAGQVHQALSKLGFKVYIARTRSFSGM